MSELSLWESIYLIGKITVIIVERKIAKENDFVKWKYHLWYNNPMKPISSGDIKRWVENLKETLSCDTMLNQLKWISRISILKQEF